jgi:hypothetical protein
MIIHSHMFLMGSGSALSAFSGPSCMLVAGALNEMCTSNRR